MSTYNRANPYSAIVYKKELISAEGSDRRVSCFGFDLADSGLTYQIGDYLGIYPKNSDATVDSILTGLEIDPETVVEVPKKSALKIREHLKENTDLNTLSLNLKKLVEEHLEAGADYNVLEALEAASFPKITPEELIKLVKPMMPRLYSVSSAPRDNKCELTVALLEYEVDNKKRQGLNTSYLFNEVEVGTEVRVFTVATPFKPPKENVPMIFVGNGTGIAPFRGFWQWSDGTHKTWLFYGNRHEKTDFFYKEELEAALQTGALTNLTTAFSRDQEHRIYVQDRILENAAEIYEWFEEGAYLYFCGNKKAGADLDEAINTIGMLNGDEDLLETLKTGKRIHKDIF